ncbi:MAG: PaaI family thioesterase [Alphaproteobacteria bacterium]|nr:PaaI family thioesterase [Alphaproteobacteria bacterium]
MTAGALDDRVDAFIRETVAKQGFRRLLGYEVTALEPGRCEMTLVPGPQHRQQDGLVHGGVFAAMADVCAGCAALTQAPAGTAVATIELKINYLRPARGGDIVVRSHVLRGGRTISVMESDVFESTADGEMPVAKALVTYALEQDRFRSNRSET